MNVGGPDRPWTLIEGGGSQTWVGCVTAAGLTITRGQTTNPRSAGPADVRLRLAELIRASWVSAGVSPSGCDVVVAAHGASSTAGSCRLFFDSLKSVLRELGSDGRLLLTNDLVPVLFGAPADDSVVVVVAGTGTGFGARSREGNWARAGGCEYVLSDEGGGFWLGLCGLRAAVRAKDGRGAATSLLDRALRWCGAGSADPLDDLFRTVYVPSFKPVVATFARHVLDAAAEDEVARGIVAAAADELVIGACAAARAAGCLGTGTRVLVSGSLLTRHGALAAELSRSLRTRFGDGTIEDATGDLLLTGYHRLREAWLSQPDVLRRLACAFPVKADLL